MPKHRELLVGGCLDEGCDVVEDLGGAQGGLEVDLVGEEGEVEDVGGGG